MAINRAEQEWTEGETVSIKVAAIKQQYRFTELSDKLDEIKDYASAGRKGNQAVSYDAIERLVWEAIKTLADIRGAMPF